ncbi:PQQ-dependent sugar dehydrogenase [Promicromonospora thailandica]|nr:PQQ-dependent sugar dehydrogenase [Promicromonospora thailandica]
MIPRSGTAAAAVLAVTLAGCGAGPAGPDPEPSAPASAAADASAPRVLATGLEAPWSVAFLGGTPLISQRGTGEILELLDDGGTRAIGTVEGVSAVGESGLLGLAVDDRDRLYAYSTGQDGNRVQRFEVTGEPGSLGLGAAETIIDGIPAAANHDGGRIAFGPDGMLYATAGDAGDPDAAQDRGSLAGKILRLTPDGDVPDDNPFPGSPVYSYGHRNPQGIAWGADGTMYAAEFGQNTWDELNVVTPGANYGWPDVEGVAGDDRFTDPVQQWSPAEASPSGIAVVGETIFVANLRGTVLRSVPVADLGSATEHHAGELGRLRDVVAAPDGEVWFLTNNTDGRGTPGPDDDRLLAVEPPAG